MMWRERPPPKRNRQRGLQYDSSLDKWRIIDTQQSSTSFNFDNTGFDGDEKNESDDNNNFNLNLLSVLQGSVV